MTAAAAALVLVATKGKGENAVPWGTLLLCCSLNLHSLKCLAAELVDTGVQRRAHQANKCGCQPGAERLCSCSNEPGENVKRRKIKQTLWSISCSVPQISNGAAARKGWLTSAATEAGIVRSRGVSGREVGGKVGVRGRDLRDFDKSTHLKYSV